MAFEFFFGIFGLVSSDSKSRHKSRLDGDWRLFTPLGAGLLRDGSQKGPPFAGSPVGFKGQPDAQRPIFSASGTLAAANNLGEFLTAERSRPAAGQPTHRPPQTVSEGLFCSASSSSVFSVSSSGSNSSAGSAATLIKAADANLAQKYEFAGDSSLAGSLGDQQQQQQQQAAAEAADGEPDASLAKSGGSRFRSVYCAAVCVSLWLCVLRLLVGLIFERTLLTLDFYYLGPYRIHFLIPALCLAIQVAAVSLTFIRNNDETNWLVPFYSSKDYLIRSRSNFKPKIEDYTRRVNLSVALGLALAAASSASISAYLVHCVMQSEVMQRPELEPLEAGAEPAKSSRQLERTVLMSLLVLDVLWAIHSTHICFLVAFYFNLICSIMKSRFHSISKIIEDLAESNTTKTTNQARKITTLYLEHNEACELLDESNDFWQYLIFFTYFTYIPAYCYCLYNLFFVDFESWPSFITWVIHTHTGFIILLISFSAAGVSTEAHAPYTSLHTLSLIQLPLDVEVNIATFLHRVRGLTIGYSCYDLFAITNASMSNTAAACASYFLIVADFSRSSVFNLAQMNGSAAAGEPAPATPSPASVSSPAGN